jgi:hypothetical protein
LRSLRVDAIVAGVTVFDLGVPVVLRGACVRARARWTEEWIAEQFGSRPCSVSFDSRPAMAANKGVLTVRDYLARRSTSEDLAYLFQTEVQRGFADDLLADLDLPPEIHGLCATGVYRLFAGPSASGTLPHVHTHALNAVVAGRKRWAIYTGEDAEQTTALVAAGYREYGSGAQATDWFANAWPTVQQRVARTWELEQSAGDVVFVPAQFLHAVVNLEPALGFTIELA